MKWLIYRMKGCIKPYTHRSYSIKELLIKFEAMTSEHFFVDADFVDYFFRREIMYISKFLNGFGNAANHLRFDIKQDLFLKCIRESAEFKIFIRRLSDTFEKP
jgi:hypothetical protein